MSTCSASKNANSHLENNIAYFRNKYGIAFSDDLKL